MRTRLICLVGAAVIASMALAPTAVAADRPADEILANYDDVKMPTLDREKRGDREYRAEYAKNRRAAEETQCDLILELYEAHPKHERLEELLPKRWGILSRIARSDEEKARSFLEELDGAAKRFKHEDLAVEALHSKAQAMTSMIRTKIVTRDELVAAVEAFVKVAPEDERAARLMMTVAQRHTPADEQVAAYRRLIERFPDNKNTKYAKGKVRQLEEVGRPFELEFTDAISGREISMYGLRGKIVVVDFWATWCGPCVREMPDMKKLYAEYADKGVEFIGVSLDNPEDKGGLKKLEDYCKDKEIPWPQYYQGNGWASEYSMSWGINGIPTMFIIDHEGRLHSVKARGKLDDLIPELLEKRKRKI